MNKAAAATFAAVLLIGMPVGYAQEVVTDPVVEANTASSLVADLQAVADRAADYAQQLATYAEIVNTYVNAVENTVGIPMAAIARVEGYYYRAEGMALQAAAIAGPDGTMMQRASMLRGLSRNGGSIPGDVGGSYRTIRQQTVRQIEENERLLGIEAARKVENDAMLRAAQDNSAEAVGRMAAIQAQSHVTASAAAQLQQTNAILAQQQADKLVKDSAVQADDEQYQADRAADIAAGRAAAANPVFMEQSPVTWGR